MYLGHGLGISRNQWVGTVHRLIVMLLPPVGLGRSLALNRCELAVNIGGCCCSGDCLYLGGRNEFRV
jgi:hypothetical protein